MYFQMCCMNKNAKKSNKIQHILLCMNSHRESYQKLNKYIIILKIFLAQRVILSFQWQVRYFIQKWTLIRFDICLGFYHVKLIQMLLVVNHPFACELPLISPHLTSFSQPLLPGMRDWVAGKSDNNPDNGLRRHRKYVRTVREITDSFYL